LATKKGASQTQGGIIFPHSQIGQITLFLDYQVWLRNCLLGSFN